MDKLVTVLTVSLPQELWIIRTKLESEEIECFIKDELTVQSYNFYSNAVGGVKLQVLEKDETRALGLLKELGYIKDEPAEPDLLSKIEKRTSNIFFLKRLPVTLRVIVLVLAISLVAGTLLYFIIRPSIYDQLTKGTWIVSRIYFNNDLIGPKTELQLHFVDVNGNPMYDETVDFRKNKEVILPGIKSSLITGNWILNDNGTITIKNVDTLKNIYEGKYDIDISGHELILKSATTTIYTYRQAF